MAGKKSGKRKIEDTASHADPAVKKVPASDASGSSKKRAKVVISDHLLQAELFVFGSNPFGALGLGEDETVKYRPAQVELADTKFTAIACGGMHTVALSVDGDVWSWGVNDEGALGRKTQGSAWQDAPEAGKQDSTIPGKADLPAGTKIVQVVAGDGITFVLTKEGSVLGCGTFKDDVGGPNGFSPTVDCAKVFTSVYEPAAARDKVKQLACGAKHVAALTQRGEVLTWGIGSQGQLGRLKSFDQNNPPTPAELFQPKPVAHLEIACGGHPVDKIACGLYSTFAITKTGHVAAWGLNNSGQLGIPKENENDNIKWSPESIEYLTKITDICGGEQHTLALTKQGTVLSFGASTYGMLGRSGVNTESANECYTEPKPVEGLEGQQVKALAAGTNVSACVASDGTAYLWGSNVNYQLAKGDDETDATVPEKLRRTKTFGFRKILAVSYGGQHGALLAGPQEAAPAPAVPAPPPEAPTAA